MNKNPKGFGHESHAVETIEWVTPQYITDALGPFDIDVCGLENPPWPIAKSTFTTDGLKRKWGGAVWCNPPYGRQVWPWLEACANHGNAMALIFARVETDGFRRVVWERASAIFFPYRRIEFCRPNGQPSGNNCGAPSAIVAYGDIMASRLRSVIWQGVLVNRWEVL